MSISNQFINHIKLDEAKRIIIAVQPKYQSYLQKDKYRQMLKKKTQEQLKEDFVKLEIGNKSCRITVRKGTEAKNLRKVETELVKNLEMALKFINLMGK